MSGAELFIVSFGITFLTARIARGAVDRTVDELHLQNPPATVANGADSWSCASCKSVNRPHATVCYLYRGDRAPVETYQGRI